jgi:YebC/PmpR family DNA-binding regulatory protein
MPADTIKRAIERSTGGGDGEQYEEITYEGYGPGGVAVLVEAATTNRNRTAAEIRSAFSKAGGQLAGTGAVAWLFEPRGVISVPRSARDPDEVALLAIDAGASDVETASDPLEIYTEPADLEPVRASLERAGVPIESGDLAMVARQSVAVDAARARQNLRLVENLEELEDVQRVTSNLELTDEILTEVAG